MRIYTWVCRACCAGWNGTVVDMFCPWCGREAECRGTFEEVPLPLK